MCQTVAAHDMALERYDWRPMSIIRSRMTSMSHSWHRHSSRHVSPVARVGSSPSPLTGPDPTCCLRRLEMGKAYDLLSAQYRLWHAAG